LAFAVTINKGQGQENERVGLDLPAPVFAHGQLYTGMSRGKRGSMVKMYNNSNTAVETIRWWKLLLPDLMEKQMMQSRFPTIPSRAVTDWNRVC
jgi:hypothetical protein